MKMIFLFKIAMAYLVVIIDMVAFAGSKAESIFLEFDSHQ